MPIKEIIEVPIATLLLDSVLQVRVAGLDADHVATLMESLDQLPPPDVVRRGDLYEVTDGAHRVAAHQNAGRTSIKVRVVKPPADGDLYGAGFKANALHGKALTLRDKSAFAAHLLKLQPKTPNMKVAARTGLSPSTVQRIREDLETDAAIEPTDRMVTRGESTYTYPAQRKPGELPADGFGEGLAQVGARLFTGRERVQQRKVASFLRRVLVAMEDGGDLIEDEAEAAEACSLVLGDDLADSLGRRLVASAAAIAKVGQLLQD